jgi:hypothetical protein
MAIVSILATAAATTLITTLRIKQRDVERGSLETLAEALPAHIRRTRTIPAATNWARELIAELALPASRISATPAGNNRVLVFDPAAFIDPIDGAAGLPYVQTTGALEPANLRLVVVSSVGAALPSLAGVGFQNLWDAAEGQIPAGFPAWNGHREDLRIQRLELGDLFHRIILNNLDATNSAVWTVDGAPSLQTLAPSSRREMWILDTSALSLYEAGNVMSFREVIRKDVSYTFEGGRWNPHVLGVDAGTGENPCGPFAELVDQFLAAPVREGAAEANKDAMVSSMFDYMKDYKTWSRRGGCSDRDSRWNTHRDQLRGHRGGCSNAARRLE